MMENRKIAILTGGGDAPGLNPAIEALVKRLENKALIAESYGIDGYGIFGVQYGWKGLVSETGSLIMLGHKDVDGIVRTGGTILGTSRENPLKDDPDGGLTSAQKLANIKSNLAGFECLVAMGGDDTLKVASKISQMGVNVIGVPKTMDLDLGGTDYSVGFLSYVNSVVETMCGFITTCKSHRRIGVAEIFGRYSGFTTAAIGLACGADYIAIPEMELNLRLMVETLEVVVRIKGYALVVVAEGINLDTRSKGALDAHGHELLKDKNIGGFLADEIEQHTNIESRSYQASHPHRGEPTAYDAIIGHRFGAKAAEMVRQGEWGQMVTIKGDAISGVIGTAPINAFEPRRVIEQGSDLWKLVWERNNSMV